MSETIRCPSCDSPEVKEFYRLNDIPVHSVLNLTNRKMALDYTRGNLRLTFCDDCGFIFNAEYDPSLQEYSSNCEESQGYSETFNLFADRTANKLVERYDLHEKTIIEIGCGKGEFLIQLCAIGNNRGIGFDPAYVDGRIRHEALERISFIRDFYSERYSGYSADFIVCKMTLEHIGETGKFARVRQTLDQRR